MDQWILAALFAALAFWNALRLPREATFLRLTWALFGVAFIALAWIDRNGSAPLWERLAIILALLPFAIASYMRNEIGQQGRTRAFFAGLINLYKPR